MESSRLGDGSLRRGERRDTDITRGKRKGKESVALPAEHDKERGRPAPALSPSDIGPPMPQTSLRELKKQAFTKYHLPRQRGDGDRGLVGGARAGGRAGKGQPNMGARMGVLLERIKRDELGACGA